MKQANDQRAQDKGTPELHQRAVIETDGKATYNRSTTPMDYYLHRSIIQRHHWEAAEMLYFYWYHGAEKSAYVVSRDPRAPKGKGDQYKREQMEQSYKAAMAAITRTVPRLTVLNVVCYGEWLADLSKEEMLQAVQNPQHYLKQAFGKNKRMELLMEGLAQLAKHFRIAPYSAHEERRSAQKVGA